jgi:hypothetical protein
VSNTSSASLQCRMLSPSGIASYSKDDRKHEAMLLFFEGRQDFITGFEADETNISMQRYALTEHYVYSRSICSLFAESFVHDGPVR